jgi:hypothetical protein
MSEAIQSWIDQATAGHGVLACGIRGADRSLMVRSARTEFSDAQMEQAMRKLYEAIYALQQNHILTERVRWSFETAQMHCVARPGGWMAVLLVNKETANAAEIERLLTEAPL